MQVQLRREDVLKPIAMVAGVVERRQTLPILSYVLVRMETDALTLTGTDLEVEVVARLGAKVAGEGSFTLPARKLFDICRALPEGSEMTLAKQGEKVAVKAGRSRFSLSSLPASDFPALEPGEFEQAITLPSEQLRGLIDRTSFCMAQQDVRYYLNGLYLEFDGRTLRAVATDGHRLAVSEAALGEETRGERQIIVPRKGIQELSRLLGESGISVRLSVGASHLRAAVGDVMFTSKLIDGKFPDYTKVIPSSTGRTAKVSRESLREALGRVAILANEKYRGVRLSFQTGVLKVSAHNPEQEEATEEIELDYSGEGMEIGFNVGYLIDALGALEGEEVVMSASDPNSSCLLSSPADETTRYVVMPMRL